MARHSRIFQLLLCTCLLILLTFLPSVFSIDCFKCVSMNGANKACDDPFHNNHSLDILESPCMGGRKGRDGLFPATSCIKIAGVYGIIVIQCGALVLSAPWWAKPFEPMEDPALTSGFCHIHAIPFTQNTSVLENLVFMWFMDGRITLHHFFLLDDTGEKITVRGCALDSGTLTTDTEIIRMSHCGRFYYDDRYVHGCLQSCNDADACNSGHSLFINKDASYLSCICRPITNILDFITLSIIVYNTLSDRLFLGDTLPRSLTVRS